MTNRKRILITGGSGLFGANALLLAPKEYSICGLYRNHAIEIENITSYQLDLTDERASAHLITEIRPNVIIHSAAESNVDICETDHSRAYRANVQVTSFLANLSRDLQSQLVFFSTDAFFNQVGYEFKEEDTPTPINYYGETKLLGEETVTKASQKNLIIRTNFHGWNMQKRLSLSEWILSSLIRGECISLFDDVFFTPIFVNDLVAIIYRLIALGESGIFNVAGSDYLSKLEFGNLLCKQFKLEPSLIQPIKVDAALLRAKRSNGMGLCTLKLQRILPDYDLSVRNGIAAFHTCLKNGYAKKIKGPWWKEWDSLSNSVR